MFEGTVLWQGIVFTIVQLFGKAFTGVWVALTPAMGRLNAIIRHLPQEITSKAESKPDITTDMPSTSSAAQNESRESYPPSSPRSKQKKPSNLYPTLLLGLAMCARGEIGLLIASVARSASDRLMPQDLFIVSVWAIVLCTIAGPVGVAQIIRRVRSGKWAAPKEWGLDRPEQTQVSQEAHGLSQ